MAVYLPDELAAGLERLGRHPDAKFLHQLLLTEVIGLDSPASELGTAQANLGRRIFARDLIRKLKFEGGNGGPDATELILRGSVQRERPDERRPLRRRLPPGSDLTKV